MKKLPAFKSYICVHSIIGINFEMLNYHFNNADIINDFVIRTYSQKVVSGIPTWSEWVIEMKEYIYDWELNNSLDRLLAIIGNKIHVFNDFIKQTNSEISIGVHCFRNGKTPILNIESKTMKLIREFENIMISISID
jgi:hypothetical protein